MSFDLLVYHNVDSRFFEFSPGDMLRPTDRLTKVVGINDLPDTLLANVPQLLENIYMQLNLDEPTQEWAKAYRIARNRSLSVGDVVQVGETAWAVANMGFTQVSIDTRQIVNNYDPPDIRVQMPDDISETEEDE